MIDLTCLNPREAVEHLYRSRTHSNMLLSLDDVGASEYTSSAVIRSFLDVEIYPENVLALLQLHHVYGGPVRFTSGSLFNELDGMPSLLRGYRVPDRIMRGVYLTMMCSNLLSVVRNQEDAESLNSLYSRERSISLLSYMNERTLYASRLRDAATRIGLGMILSVPYLAGVYVSDLRMDDTARLVPGALLHWLAFLAREESPPTTMNIGMAAGLASAIVSVTPEPIVQLETPTVTLQSGVYESALSLYADFGEMMDQTLLTVVRAFTSARLKSSEKLAPAEPARPVKMRRNYMMGVRIEQKDLGFVTAPKVTPPEGAEYADNGNEGRPSNESH